MLKTKLRFFCPVLILFSLSLAAVPSNAEIREIKSIREVVPSLAEGTLIVFDIDNTLMAPTGYLGSDEWFYLLYKVYRINGADESGIARTAMDVWNKTQWRIDVKAVEKETPLLIKKEQAKGNKVMALTARTFDIADRTIAQLGTIGIDFSSASVSGKESIFPKTDFKSDDDVLVKKGIIFVGESNVKGKVLAYYLQKMNYHPKKVVYIDDREKHVKSVSETLETIGIPCLSFRYGAADEKVKRFNEVFSEVSVRTKEEEELSRLFLYGEAAPTPGKNTKEE
jgi:hypothetical protein